MINTTFDKIAQDLALDETASPAARLLANAVLLRAVEDDDLAIENQTLDKLAATLRGKLREAEDKLESAYQIGRDATLAVQNIEQAKFRELQDEYRDAITQVQALEVRLADAQAQPASDPTLVEKLRRDIKDFSVRDGAFQTKISEFREANIRLLKEKEVIVAERDGLSEENDALAQELEMADAALQELYKEWRGMEARAVGAETAHDALQGKLKRAEANATASAKRVEGLERQLSDARERVEAKTFEQRASLANLRDLEQQNLKLRNSAEVVLNDDLLAERAKLQAQVKELVRDNDAKTKELARYRAADVNAPAPLSNEALIATINEQAKFIAGLQAELRSGFQAGSIETADSAPVLIACQSDVDLLSLRNTLWHTTLAPHLIFAVIGDDKPTQALGGIIVMPRQAKGLAQPETVRTHEAIRKLDWLVEVKRLLTDGASILTLQPQ